MRILRCSRGKIKLFAIYRTANLTFRIYFNSLEDAEWFTKQVNDFGIIYYTIFEPIANRLTRLYLFNTRMGKIDVEKDLYFTDLDVRKFTSRELEGHLIKKIHDRDWKNILGK